VCPVARVAARAYPCAAPRASLARMAALVGLRGRSCPPRPCAFPALPPLPLPLPLSPPPPPPGFMASVAAATPSATATSAACARLLVWSPVPRSPVCVLPVCVLPAAPPPAVFARAWARSHYRLAPAATASPQSPPSPPPRLSRPRRHRLAAIATVSPPSPPPRLGTMPLPPPCRPSRRRVRVRVVTACRPFRCAGRSAAPPGRARRLLIARSRARWPVRGVLRRAATAVMRLVAA
jgi:hypothetical protein